MGICPRALYSDLLWDLSPYLGHDVREALERGSPVTDWPGMGPRARAALALSQSFYKKFVDQTEPTAESLALEKFLQINDEMRNFELRLVGSWQEEMFGTFKEVLYRFFRPLNSEVGAPDGELLHADAILGSARAGPGASLGANGNDFYTKMFSSRLTLTNPSLYELYARHVKFDYRWRDAENLRRESFGSYSVVKGNRLNFVPKTKVIARTICTEPSLNMWFQLGIGRLFEERLERYFGISLSNQPEKNRAMAKIGSLDGSFSTIDLSSASDSMSMGLLEQVLPPEILWWLKLTRSPASELPDGSLEELHMISTMGNGYTFPLQTILFASAVVAVYTSLGLKPIRPRGGSLGNFGVFGDDIIVVGRAYAQVCSFLEALGFSVNRDKSFSEGPFRESCGEDYFLGKNVRGVYVRSLRTVQDRFSVINRLNRWSASHGIALWQTVQRLLRTVPKHLVPPWEQDDAGIKVPYSLVRDKRRDKHTRSILYRRWVAVPTKLKVTDEAILNPRGHKKRIFNTEGLRLAFLHGGLRSMEISVRLDRVPYRQKYGIAPNWDNALVEQFGKVGGAMAPYWSSREDFARWERAVWSNTVI